MKEKIKKYFIILIIFCPPIHSSKEKSRYEKLELFSNVLNLIESRYYREIDNEKLIQGAIKGMMSTLDPHSNFLNEKFFKKIKEDSRGEFEGLGIEVTLKKGYLFIIAAIEGTPAHKIGLQSGDKIVEINDRSTLGMNLEEAVNLMRGKVGTKITLGIRRNEDQKIKQYTIKREMIRTRPIAVELIDKHYLYLKLVHFQKRSATSIIKALKKHSSQDGGLKGIILDLRNNPGGLLKEAIEVTSIFLSGGIIVSTEDRNKKRKDVRYVSRGQYKDFNTPMVVLINNASASASEIVAGALQDHKRAIIMGTKSFGKGSIQDIIKIDKTQGVKLTIAQYMTPSGKKIQDVGIIPDITSSEYEGRYDQEMAKELHHNREMNLKNYLTSIIETETEKKQRLARDLAAKKQRIQKLKKQEKKQNDKNQFLKKQHPKEDFQVILAIKHLKSFELVKSMLKR